jgi:SAM-dependent methyltransferase
LGVIGSGCRASDAAIWDEVEHGSYAADLRLWGELAAERDPVLELGCGTGRVALHLVRLGHEVWALDRDPDLTGALRRRAGDEGVAVRAVDADAVSFELDASFALILAPMQLVQLLDAGDRAAALERVRAHLAPDGLFAAALVDPPVAWGEPGERPLPDVRERDGWVFSSLPLCVRTDGRALVVERLRQAVSPAGELSEERHAVRIEVLEPQCFEAEAGTAGLTPVGRRAISQTAEHVGSTVVLLSRADAREPGDGR